MFIPLPLGTTQEIVDANLKRMEGVAANRVAWCEETDRILDEIERQPWYKKYRFQELYIQFHVFGKDPGVSIREAADQLRKEAQC